MRLIVQPFAGGFELCARLGLLLIPAEKLGSAGLGGKIVHGVLVDSPSARAGIEARDIVFSVDKARWDSIRYLTFSDRLTFRTQSLGLCGAIFYDRQHHSARAARTLSADRGHRCRGNARRRNAADAVETALCKPARRRKQTEPHVKLH